MKKIGITLAALGLLACNGKKEEQPVSENAKPNATSTLEDAKWLLGTWQNVIKEGTLTETWALAEDSAMTGKTALVSGKDTLFSETIRLEQKDGNLCYIVTAKEQNDEKPVSFPLTSISGNEMVFENPKHDYPTKIVYENHGDSVMAYITGHKLGVEVKEEFPMKRIK